MNQMGHWGAALLFAAPGALATAAITGNPYLSTPYVAFAVAFSRAPDIDQRLPFISHRGATHTLAFALLLTAVAAVATSGALQYKPFPEIPLSTVTLLALVPGGVFTGVVSHLAADMLTEGYDYAVTPFWPLSDQTYQLGIASASSVFWNTSLLLCGGLSYIPLFLLL